MALRVQYRYTVKSVRLFHGGFLKRILTWITPKATAYDARDNSRSASLEEGHADFGVFGQTVCDGIATSTT